MKALLSVFVVSLSTAQAASPDIVVYSGVPCGIAASITAAREGAETVFFELTKHVGGLNTRGINTAESETPRVRVWRR